MADRILALVTGASSGIGLELARCAARDGCDLVICAERPEIEEAAVELRAAGASVIAVQADLSSRDGVEQLLSALNGREVDYLMANAGRSLGHAFVEQGWADIAGVIGVNVVGTTALLHEVLPGMIARGRGRVLITGSIAGYIPGSFQAVYNGTKAFLDSLSYALRDELSGSGVTVTCLMPGATETEIFERAGMEDTPVGKAEKADPADVAAKGYAAMLKGSSGITTGFMNKLQVAFAGIIPEPILARMHRRVAEPER